MRKRTITILLDDYLPNVTSTIDIKLHYIEFMFTHSWGHERSSTYVIRYSNSEFFILSNSILFLSQPILKPNPSFFNFHKSIKLKKNFTFNYYF